MLINKSHKSKGNLEKYIFFSYKFFKKLVLNDIYGYWSKY